MYLIKFIQIIELRFSLYSSIYSSIKFELWEKFLRIIYLKGKFFTK